MQDPSEQGCDNDPSHNEEQTAGVKTQGKTQKESEMDQWADCRNRKVHEKMYGCTVDCGARPNTITVFVVKLLHVVLVMGLLECVSVLKLKLCKKTSMHWLFQKKY